MLKPQASVQTMYSYLVLLIERPIDNKLTNRTLFMTQCFFFHASLRAFACVHELNQDRVLFILD
jgi:hypothetical protein